MLKDKVAIVTGGDSGIGHAIALELAAQGAAVTVNFHRNEAAATATVKAITDAGGRARIQQGDVSNVDDIVALVDATVAAFGRLDGRSWPRTAPHTARPRRSSWTAG